MIAPLTPDERACRYPRPGHPGLVPVDPLNHANDAEALEAWLVGTTISRRRVALVRAAWAAVQATREAEP